MKKNILPIIFIIYSFISYGIMAQDLIPFAFNGLYGYVDDKLNVIIPPKYDRAGYFSDDGYAVVRYPGTQSEVINKCGETLLRVRTGIIYNVCEDLFSYQSNEYGSIIIRLSDNKIIANGTGINGPVYGNGYILATFTDDDRYRFLDHNGNRVLAHLQMKRPSYSFFEQRAVITKSDWSTVIIDMGGNTVGNLDIYRIGQKYSEGLIPVQISDGTTGYVNLSGEFAFKIPFIVSDVPEATDFQNGYALIKIQQNPSLWKIINREGQTISGNLQIRTAEKFSNSLSLISVNNAGTVKYSYVNTKGEFIVTPLLDNADTFENGYARIIYNGRDGLINILGKIFWSDDIINKNPTGYIINY
ncbi:hypothetical protein FACS1894151_06670 [Spirochaetia bacterium]|nr:hypothetical protein FACS1894151_06670 [Spirochaetia bacterium]